MEFLFFCDNSTTKFILLMFNVSIEIKRNCNYGRQVSKWGAKAQRCFKINDGADIHSIAETTKKNENFKFEVMLAMI